MQKTKTQRYILWILLFLAAGLVFWFSSQNAENSSKLSWDVVEQVAEHAPMHQNVPDSIETAKKSAAWDAVHWFVRKMAHFTLYFIIGFLLMCLMRSYQKCDKKHVLIALLIGAVYALSDEFHQYFVPGRDAKLLDVLIDTTGVFAGIALSFAAAWLHGRLKRK